MISLWTWFIAAVFLANAANGISCGSGQYYDNIALACLSCVAGMYTTSIGASQVRKVGWGSKSCSTFDWLRGPQMHEI